MTNAILKTQPWSVALRVVAHPVYVGEWVVLGPRLDGAVGDTVLYGPDTLLACNEARNSLEGVIQV